jgi:hypothetical protein
MWKYRFTYVATERGASAASSAPTPAIATERRA